jgi:hypothetical protein
MVNKKPLFPKSIFLVTLTTVAAFAAAPAFGDDGSYVTRSYSSETLGKTTGASVSAGNPAATQTVETNANLTVIGHSLNALNARTESPASLTGNSGTGGTVGGCTTVDCVDIGGTAYTTVYSFGKAVLANAFSITSGGYNNVKIGLAPTEVRVPFVVYAVGPLTLDVAGGVRFQANLDATLTPVLVMNDLKTSQLQVNLQALAEAGGFVEAYAALLVIRGGVGGQVDLIDGNLGVNGLINFDGSKPAVFVNGKVQFFNGRFYAFLDFFNLLNLGWKRLIDHTLYQWNGICYAMGAEACPAK